MSYVCILSVLNWFVLSRWTANVGKIWGKKLLQETTGSSIPQTGVAAQSIYWDVCLQAYSQLTAFHLTELSQVDFLGFDADSVLNCSLNFLRLTSGASACTESLFDWTSLDDAQFWALRIDSLQHSTLHCAQTSSLHLAKIPVSDDCFGSFLRSWVSRRFCLAELIGTLLFSTCPSRAISFSALASWVYR